MNPLIIIVCSLLLVYSCNCFFSYKDYVKHKIEKSSDIDLKQYKAIIIIPGSGCTGCVTKAEALFRLRRNSRDTMFIFTDIRTIKGLKTKMSGIDIFNQNNTYIDSTNICYGEYVDNIYPLIVNIVSGKINKVTKL